MNTVRLLYKSYVVKKSDVLESYTCVDIDEVMAQECMEKYGTLYNSCNASFLIQDLTVKPKLDVPDNYYDLIICTEFLEHINPDKSQAILEIEIDIPIVSSTVQPVATNFSINSS